MFITLEGIEGAGKSSQLQNIVAFFKSRGYECVTTREPGGTAIGQQIRGILLDPANRDLDAGAELLLYVADRIQHIKTVIEPHLGDRRGGRFGRRATAASWDDESGGFAKPHVGVSKRWPWRLEWHRTPPSKSDARS